MIPPCPLAVEPRQSRGHCGLLSHIQTPISTQAFTDHYTLIPGKELGRGKFAVVRKCVEKCTGKEYAAKFMRKRRKGQDCRSDIIHEIAVLELSTSSSRVVNLHKVYEMRTEMVLVLEFAAGGELFHQCVSEEQPFSRGEVQRLLRQILEGVAFLHQNNLVHLDLKPQNILLTSAAPLGDIKIVDFGLSRVVSSQQELREIMGTPEYVAPEILNYEPISTATDMWSIGVLAYIMLTGVSPFLGEDKQETFLNISQLNVSYSEEELEPAAVAFIQTLLRKHPHERATAKQCLGHPWLQWPQDPHPQTQVPIDQQEESSLSSTPDPAREEEDEDDEERGPVREEEDDDEERGPVREGLLMMAAYALGQCRQTSAEHCEEKKHFHFQEPFRALQEVPGEFIY